jgi:uncharacterized membrane protein
MSSAAGSNETISTRRLEAFTDGVFAIAATLLVLDLNVGKFGSSIRTDADLWQALGGMYGDIISFTISFVILASQWSLHTRQFEHVVRVNATLLALNSLRLFGVVLVPFSTSLNSTYTQFLAGKMLLPLNFFAITLVGTIQWFYVTSASRDLTSNLDTERRTQTRRSAVIAVACSIIVVLLAPALGPWAFFAFFLRVPLDRIAQRYPAGLEWLGFS